jgi:hypothetical protein
LSDARLLPLELRLAWAAGPTSPFTASVRLVPGWAFGEWRCPLALKSVWVGVGHCAAIVSSDGFPFVAYVSRPSPGQPLFDEP